MNNQIPQGAVRATFLLLLFLITPVHAGLLDFGSVVYDSTTNLTWTADANLSKTLGDDADGRMTVLGGGVNALNWTSGLVHGGFSDWRNPLTSDTCAAPGGATGCANSEIGSLFYDGLGGVQGVPSAPPTMQAMTFSAISRRTIPT